MKKARTKNPTKKKKPCHMQTNDVYKLYNGVKLLEGYTQEEYQMHCDIIGIYKNILPIMLLQEQHLSTISAVGKLKNLNFNEDRVMQDIKFVDGVRSAVGSAVRIFNPALQAPPQNILKAFKSQLTVEVEKPDSDKTYKVKVFRNGTIQIPGITETDMHDVIEPLNTVCQFMQKTLGRADINAEFIKATMRNYGLALANPKCGIIISKLMEAIGLEFGMRRNPIGDYARIKELAMVRFGKRGAFIFLRYFHVSIVRLNRPRQEPQKASGVLVTLCRYTETEKKDLTIRALTSGKIAFNGANSNIEVDSVLHWLNFVLAKYYDSIVYDPRLNERKWAANLDKLKTL